MEKTSVGQVVGLDLSLRNRWAATDRHSGQWRLAKLQWASGRKILADQGTGNPAT